VTVTKVLHIAPTEPGFAATYQVTNRSGRFLPATFAVEFNLNMLGGGGNPAAYRRLAGATVDDARFDSDGEMPNATSVVAGNHLLGVELRIDAREPATAWWSSIESISSSEGGFERVHQGSALLFSWALDLPPGQARELVLHTCVTG
jgi:alpha-amylase